MNSPEFILESEIRQHLLGGGALAVDDDVKC